MEGASSNPGRGLPRARDTSRNRHILTHFWWRALKSLPGKAEPSWPCGDQPGSALLLQPQCPSASSLRVASPSHPISGFPGGSVKNLPVNAGDARDMGLILGLGRSPRGGNGKLLQHSCPKSLIDRKPAKLQFTGSQRVRHDWATEHALTLCCAARNWIEKGYWSFQGSHSC